MKIIRFIISFTIVMMAAFISYAQTHEKWTQDGKIYLKFKDDVALPFQVQQGEVNLERTFFLKDEISEFGIQRISCPFYQSKDAKLERTFLVEFTDYAGIDELIRRISSYPQIEYAEKVPIFKLFLTPNDTYYGTLSGLLGSVNGKWHLDAISAEQAWNISTGNPNVKVAVLDNGIYTSHPDLVNKIVAQVDLADNDNDPTPPSVSLTWSHGTHTSGLVGAQTNNNLGVASIGYNVSLMAVKVGRDSDGAITAGFEGIMWAADHGADVISMSWGSKQYFQTMQNIVNYAYNKGCVMVAAAGNDGNDTIQYPAGLHHVISVASVDQGDGFSSFSCYGPWIDVCAPGGFASGSFLFSILSTTYSNASWLGAQAYGVTGKYDVMSGTSMSAPIVAGVCALMLSVDSTLTPEKLTNILKLSCDNIDAQNPTMIGKMGAGRVNAYHALQMVQDSMSALVADFYASNTLVMVNDSVDFFDQSTGNPTSWYWQFPGGTPSTSTATNPTNIYYSAPGAYPVILTVSDGLTSNTETKTNFIYVKAPASSAWLPQATGFATQYRGIQNISIVNPQIVWASAYDGSGAGANVLEFTRTTNGGAVWTPGNIGIPSNCQVSELFAINADTAWVATWGNTSGGNAIFRTNDGGATWTAQATASFSGSAAFANTIYFWDANNGVCMGDPNGGYFEIYTTTDGGNNWVRVPQSNIPAPLSGEYGYNGGKDYDVVGDIIWFGTNKGRVFKSTNRGLNWTVSSTGLAEVNNVAFSDENNGIVQYKTYNSSTGQITTFIMKRTVDGGNTWLPLQYTGNIFKSDISAVPGKPGMYITTGSQSNLSDCGSAFSLDYGFSWTMIDDSVQYTCVKFHDLNTGWAGGFNTSPTVEGIWKWMGLIQDSSTIIADFIADSTTIFVGHSVNFTDLSLGNITNWSWSFPGGAPATSNVQHPSGITYNAVGNYSVTLTASNNDTTVVKTKTAYIKVINPSGVAQPSGTSFTVYPNPACDKIFVQTGTLQQISEIRICDITGKCLYRNEPEGNSGLYMIDVSGFSMGLYIIEIISNNELLREKISIR